MIINKFENKSNSIKEESKENQRYALIPFHLHSRKSNFFHDFHFREVSTIS